MHGKKSSPAEARAVHWALALGEERQVRDEAAARTAKSQEEDETRMIETSAERWAAIVAGIRQIADAYNTAAGPSERPERRPTVHNRTSRSLRSS